MDPSRSKHVKSTDRLTEHRVSIGSGYIPGAPAASVAAAAAAAARRLVLSFQNNPCDWELEQKEQRILLAI